MCCRASHVVLLVAFATAEAQQPSVMRSAGEPRVSPDGRWVAFVGREPGTAASIYLVRPDGSGLRKLRGTTSPDDMEAWAHDGASLVFRHSGANDSSVIGRITIADTNTTWIATGWPKNGWPSLSPDGGRLTLVVDGDPQKDFGIFTIAVDGSTATPIAHGMQPEWSPDGRRIVFAASPPGGGSPKIFIVNADGTNRSQLSTGEGADEYPTWSRDAKRIAFQRARKLNGRANAEIHIVNADGAGDRTVAAHATPFLDEIPSWFPDGTRLAIQSDRDDGVMRIFIIDLSGGIARRLTP